MDRNVCCRCYSFDSVRCFRSVTQSKFEIKFALFLLYASTSLLTLSIINRPAKVIVGKTQRFNKQTRISFGDREFAIIWTFSNEKRHFVNKKKRPKQPQNLGCKNQHTYNDDDIISIVQCTFHSWKEIKPITTITKSIKCGCWFYWLNFFLWSIRFGHNIRFVKLDKTCRKRRSNQSR